MFRRKRWDSNPRKGLPFAGFQDRCLQPLGHASGAASILSAAPVRQLAAADTVEDKKQRAHALKFLRFLSRERLDADGMPRRLHLCGVEDPIRILCLFREPRLFRQCAFRIALEIQRASALQERSGLFIAGAVEGSRRD